MREPLSKIMTSNLITINQEDTLDKVRDFFFTYNIHHLPVVEGKKLVGMVSTNDLLKLNRDFEEYSKIQVKEIMVTKVGTLSEKEQIGAAAEVFLHNRFHALPIVNEDRELVGLVTTMDVLKYQHDNHYED